VLNYLLELTLYLCRNLSIFSLGRDVFQELVELANLHSCIVRDSWEQKGHPSANIGTV
jgi:hypothetical protein